MAGIPHIATLRLIVIQDDNEGGAHDDDWEDEDGHQFHNKMVMVEMFMSNISNCCRKDNYTKLTGESSNITPKQDW